MAAQKKDNTKEFYVNARIHMDTTICIRANDMKAALEQVDKLQLEDFIEVRGDNNEHTWKLTGLFEATTELKA